MEKEELIDFEEECVVILVSIYKFGIIPFKELTEEQKETLNTLVEALKPLGLICLSFYEDEEDKYLSFLTKKSKAKDLFKLLDEKNYDPKIANKYAIMDKRYIEDNKFKDFVSDIPPVFLDKYITEFLLQYGEEEDIKLISNKKTFCTEYHLELYPGIEIIVIYNKLFLFGGLGKGRATYLTKNPKKYYKILFNDLKEDIDKWIFEHPGITKINFA